MIKCFNLLKVTYFMMFLDLKMLLNENQLYVLIIRFNLEEMEEFIHREVRNDEVKSDINIENLLKD